MEVSEEGVRGGFVREGRYWEVGRMKENRRD
jgi:hypothetical protein